MTNNATTISTKITLETVLESIGITRETVRKDAYDHWKRFVQLVNLRSGRSWHNDIRPKMRSWLGIDYRYIDAYLDACLSWGIMEIKNEKLFFIGIPQDSPVLERITEAELTEELYAENYNRLKLGKPAVSLEEYKKQREQQLSEKISEGE